MGTNMGRRKRRRWAGLGAGFVLGAVAVAAIPSAQGTARAAHTASQSRMAPAAGQPGGDIPDSAVYLRYVGRGFSIEYVEGWLQTAAARGVTFNDKDSLVAVELRPRVAGALAAYVQQVDLPRLARTAGFARGALTRDFVGGHAAMRLSFRDRSAADAVTGKTVALQSDRYYVQGSRALAVITLSTPLGVDNVDGFRRIAHSFRFR